MPGTFIELATELGLLDDITCIVLEQVAASVPQLKGRFGEDVSVSLNVSARQVEDAQFMRIFLGQLADSGVAESIIIELTEDALVATQRFQRTVLPTLRGPRRASLDRRFRNRLFLVVDACGHHRRRSQSRPRVHHFDPFAGAQPGHPARDRIAVLRAGCGHAGRRCRIGRRARVSACPQLDPVRAGISLSRSRSFSRRSCPSRRSRSARKGTSGQSKKETPRPMVVWRWL